MSKPLHAPLHARNVALFALLVSPTITREGLAQDRARETPAAFASAASAARSERNHEGTVLGIDAGELVVDLGQVKGARDGMRVQLWRPLRVRHPVTGQMFTDRFLIGSVSLTQVRKTLSLARVEGTFTRPPATGDVVVLADEDRPSVGGPSGDVKLPPTLSAASSASAATTPSIGTVDAARATCPPTGGCVGDPEAEALSKLFLSLRGAAPSARAEAYASFVRAHPKSRYSSVLEEEAAALRREDVPPERPYESSSAPVMRLRPGAPQRLAFELDARFVGAIAHARQKGATAYRSMKMGNLGPSYWAATLPGDAVQEGEMEYFVEGVLDDGRAVPVVGSADKPREVEVERTPSFGKTKGVIAQVQLQSEYVSFNTRAANDYVYYTEGQSGWRLGALGVRAVRSGFGVLRGKGGPLAVLDAGGAPTDVGLTYGYVEAEWGLTPTLGVVTRPIIGLREGGVAGGAQGFFRVGNDLATNLLIGGEVLGTVGLRGVVQLDWRTIRRVPVVFRSEVTNQPAGTGGDVGARAIAQVGYEIIPELVVAGRVSYQGRTINHAGPGAGLAVNYQW